MPFTPFHMGPGAVIKAVSGKYFSLTVFGFSQILIDIEPLIRILNNQHQVHGLTHTYLGALFIGFFSMLLGKPVCEWLLHGWNYLFRAKFLAWFKLPDSISWLAAGLGAFIGTFSHVLLDSMIHSDVQPFAPFIEKSSGLLHFMPAGWIYLICAALGVLGFMLIILIGLWNKWAIEID